MVVTLRSGKELKRINEAEMKQTEVETEKIDQNSTIGKKKLSRNGLSSEIEQMKTQIEVAKDESLQKEEVRVYQPLAPFLQRL